MLEDIIPPNRYPRITLKLLLVVRKDSQGPFFINVGRPNAAAAQVKSNVGGSSVRGCNLTLTQLDR